MTLAVDWDVKHQFKQANKTYYLACAACISNWPLQYFFNIHRRTDSLPKSLDVSDGHLLFICDALVEVNHIFLKFKKPFSM